METEVAPENWAEQLGCESLETHAMTLEEIFLTIVKQKEKQHAATVH
ncbi:MAG: hypothetical protein ACFHW5_19845 [Verrucomicrobiota bacterium]